jgi:hypothetical protein
MCVMEEQTVDDNEDFRQMVELSDSTEDLVAILVHHLTELPPVLHEIRGPAPPESKVWFTQHQAQRRTQAAADRDRLREDAKAAKAEQKAEAAAEKAEAALAKVSMR